MLNDCNTILYAMIHVSLQPFKVNYKFNFLSFHHQHSSIKKGAANATPIYITIH